MALRTGSKTVDAQAAGGVRGSRIAAAEARNRDRRVFLHAARSAIATLWGVDRHLAAFYRERYLLAEADAAVEKELQGDLNENPARVIPALDTIR